MPIITIDDRTDAKLKELARKLGRTEEEALRCALESGLQYNLWFAEQALEAKDSMDRGEHHTFE